MDESDNKIEPILDETTPINAIFSAYYKRSFAHFTIKERCPVILTNIVDTLARSKHEIYIAHGDEGVTELKSIIGEISKLKHELQTNKQLPQFNPTSNDLIIYNDFIRKQLDLFDSCTYFSTHSLFVECFMYRKIADFFHNTTYLQQYDYFANQKDASFNAALPLIKSLADNLLAKLDSNCRELLQTDFANLLKLNLWGNRCDLCLSEGVIEKTANGFAEMLANFEENILCNQTEEVFEAIRQKSSPGIVDFVCDNSGYEIFTDLCLADFLISNNLAKIVRFHIKSLPWFISDVTQRDIPCILRKLVNSEEKSLRRLGSRWSGFFDEDVWMVEESDFWTTYFTFKQMEKEDEVLYCKLSQCDFIFFKGDLNYRKLLGDRNWDHGTPFADALDGFHPSKLCALRTLKSDIICGLNAGLDCKLDERDKDWQVSGNYGIIQFCGKVNHLS